MIDWAKIAVYASAALLLSVIAYKIVDYIGDSREAKIRAADAVEYQKLKADADKESKALLARALKAEGAYDAEHEANLAYAAHPITASELCRQPSQSVRSVQRGSAEDSGDAASSAPAAVVPGVPPADHGLADDRRTLLGALALLADEQSAALREWQAR